MYVCILLLIAYNSVRRLILTATYVLRAPWVPSTGAQSNKFTCKHTESAVSTKLAYDVSSLAAAPVSTVHGAPSVIIPRHWEIAMYVYKVSDNILSCSAQLLLAY